MLPLSPPFAVLDGASAQSQVHWGGFILCECVRTKFQLVCSPTVHSTMQSYDLNTGGSIHVKSYMISYDSCICTYVSG